MYWILPGHLSGEVHRAPRTNQRKSRITLGIMSNHDFLIDDGADPRRTEPSWVTAVLWLLPKQVFAVVAIAVTTFVSSMSYFFASVEKSSVA